MASYTLEMLTRMARIQPATIRSYVAQGLLPRAVLRGPKTTYDDGYLARVLAVRYLLHTERLSAEHREVIDLVYYHDKSIEQVAEIVGAPEGTVKTRVFYARRKLSELAKAAGIDRGWP